MEQSGLCSGSELSEDSAGNSSRGHPCYILGQEFECVMCVPETRENLSFKVIG